MLKFGGTIFLLLVISFPTFAESKTLAKVWGTLITDESLAGKYDKDRAFISLIERQLLEGYIKSENIVVKEDDISVFLAAMDESSSARKKAINQRMMERLKQSIEINREFVKLSYEEMFSEFQRSISITTQKVEELEEQLKALDKNDTKERKRIENIISIHKEGIHRTKNELSKEDWYDKRIARTQSIIERDEQSIRRGTTLNYPEIAKGYILQWNVLKSLHNKYGGRVQWQQLGYESIEAYLAFWQDMTDKGLVQIYSPAYKKLYREHFDELRKKVQELDERCGSASRFVQACVTDHEVLFKEPPWEKKLRLKEKKTVPR